MGIEVLISALVANLLTGIAKPKEVNTYTAEEKSARAALIRIMNAAFALIALFAAAWISGDAVDVTEMTGLIETFTTLVVTFLTGQGGYALIKGWFK